MLSSVAQVQGSSDSYHTRDEEGWERKEENSLSKANIAILKYIWHLPGYLQDDSSEYEMKNATLFAENAFFAVKRRFNCGSNKIILLCILLLFSMAFFSLSTRSCGQLNFMS